jgi:hypothetical protein
MAYLPFWDPGAVDPNRQGEEKAPGIVTLLPPYVAPLPDEISSWDVIVLNGMRCPGKCVLEGGRHIPFSYEAALGQVQGSSWFFGFDPVQFTMRITLWTPWQFEEFQDLLPQLLPFPGPNPQLRAVAASHPSLALVGVDTIYIQGMELPRAVGPGMMEFVFNCYEWRPPQEIMQPMAIPSAPPQTSGAPNGSTPVVIPPSGSGIAP